LFPGNIAAAAVPTQIKANSYFYVEHFLLAAAQKCRFC
jgi:hypothetical protein